MKSIVLINLFSDVCDPSKVDMFGSPPNNPSSCSTQSGWLCLEKLVEIKLMEKSVQMWRSKHKDRRLRVKLTPVDVGTVIGVGNSSSNSGNSGNCSALQLMHMDESVDVDVARERKAAWPIVSVAVSLGSVCVMQHSYGTTTLSTVFLIVLALGIVCAMKKAF